MDTMDAPDTLDTITIEDLCLLCRVGVPDEERAKPQKLLVTVEVAGDFARACASDDIADTINYYDLTRQIQALTREKEFRLIERLADEIATLALTKFGAESVRVQVKKFILPEARYVAFALARRRQG